MRFYLDLRVIPLLLALASCRGESAPEVGAADPARDEQVDSAATALPGREEFVDRGLRPAGTTRASLAGTLGQPDSIAYEVIPNRHVPGERDTLFTIYYPDLVASVHRPGPGGELLSRVSVMANRHLRYPALGATENAVTAAFGTPDERTDSSLTYHCTTCVAGDNPVVLFLQDGRVHRVQFNFYVD